MDMLLLDIVVLKLLQISLAVGDVSEIRAKAQFNMLATQVIMYFV